MDFVIGSNMLWRVIKLGRFIRRLYIWFPVLWETENWDYIYLINIIELQLKEMERGFTKDKLFTTYQQEARKIRIVLEHIKRFKDIDSYTETVAPNEWWANHVHWVPQDEVINKRHMLVYAREDRLETWHFNEIFRRLSKHLRGWWS